MIDMLDLRCECYCAFDANTGERLEHCGVCRAADEIERLRRERDYHREQELRLANEVHRLMGKLAEARNTITRLLRDGILNTPCPTPRQWQQLKDFAAGYLAATPDRESEVVK